MIDNKAGDKSQTSKMKATRILEVVAYVCLYIFIGINLGSAWEQHKLGDELQELKQKNAELDMMLDTLEAVIETETGEPI